MSDPADAGPDERYAIRRAEIGDIPEIAALRLAFARIVKTESAGALPATAARDLESRIARRMACGSSLFFVAAGRGGIFGAGEISLDRRSRDARSARAAEILNLHVASGRRRRGIGSALLRAMIDECAARGMKRIVLQPTEDGRTIYARAGFAHARGGKMELDLAPSGQQAASRED